MKHKSPSPMPDEAVRFRRTTVYSPPEPLLTLESTCCELVDKLMAICRGEPEFLRSDACHRYIALLPEFRRFVFTERLYTAVRDEKARVVSVGDMLIRQIGPAIEEWVFSYFGDEFHPLLPHYALDTAQFIARMRFGYLHSFWEQEGCPRIEVKPVVRLTKDELPGTSFVDDRRLKTDFTKMNRLLRAVCRVPVGGLVTRLANERDEHLLFRTGEEFLFHVRRCHLSSGSRNEFVEAKCCEPERLDMQDEFRFFGHIQLGDGFQDGDWLATEVPAHWITAAMTQDDNRLPVPF